MPPPYLRLWRAYNPMSRWNAYSIIFSLLANIGIVTTVLAHPDVIVRRGWFEWVVGKAVSRSL